MKIKFKKRIHLRKKKKRSEWKFALPLSLFVILILTLALAGKEAVDCLEGRPFLRPWTQNVFAWIQPHVGARGVQPTVLEFEDVHWKFPNRVIWKNISLHICSESGKTISSSGAQGALKAREIEVKFPKFLHGEFWVAVRGGFFDVASNSSPERRIEFLVDHCQLRFYVPWWPLNRLRPQLRELFNELPSILKNGKTRIPIKLSGRIRFQIYGKQTEVRVWFVKDGEEYRLRMSTDDLKSITESYSEKVSDDEIEVLSRYPLWVSKALRITDEARAISNAEFKKNENVPRDAFRHVWWSYHLTKAFGPDFSRELTDAHESGSTTNTEADHIMDYRNNQIGSDAALEDYPEGSLLFLTMTDPNVYRSTEEVYQEVGIF